MVETVYQVLGIPVKLCLLADFHNRPNPNIISSLRKNRPDLILIAGDVFYSTYPLVNQVYVPPFLEGCAKIAPTYYSIFKHEWRGVFNPDEGFFPRYSKGKYENGRLIISADLTNTAPVPRFFNPTEVVYIEKPDQPKNHSRNWRYQPSKKVNLLGLHRGLARLARDLSHRLALLLFPGTE